jgi:hypothetical protein
MKLSNTARVSRWLALFSQLASFAMVVAVIVPLAPQGARGNGTAYEPFNYSPVGSAVAGQGSSNTVGFANNWYGDSSFTLASGSIASPIALPASSGNSVTAAPFGANRNLSRDLSQSLGADNTTAFFSFIMQPEGTAGNGAFGGWFGFSLFGGARNIGVGKDSFHGTFSLGDNLGDPPVETNVPVVSGQAHFFVLAADFLPGNDVYQLYIDPQTGQPQPGTAAATLNFDLQSVTTIGLAGPGAFGFDELRIGTTWADVTPVPEPNSLALATGGLFLMFVALHGVRSPCSGARPLPTGLVQGYRVVLSRHS